MNELNHGFDKQLRLLNASDYRTVFDDVQFKISSQHFLLLCRPTTLDHPRIGLVVAKRHVKRANQRNRIKRLLREAFRHQQHALPGVDIVALVKPSIDKQENAELYKQLDNLWRRLRKQNDRQTVSANVGA